MGTVPGSTTVPPNAPQHSDPISEPPKIGLSSESVATCEEHFFPMKWMSSTGSEDAVQLDSCFTEAYRNDEVLAVLIKGYADGDSQDRYYSSRRLWVAVERFGEVSRTQSEPVDFLVVGELETSAPAGKRGVSVTLVTEECNDKLGIPSRSGGITAPSAETPPAPVDNTKANDPNL